jgi:hypothetical protein
MCFRCVKFLLWSNGSEGWRGTVSCNVRAGQPRSFSRKEQYLLKEKTVASAGICLLCRHISQVPLGQGKQNKNHNPVRTIIVPLITLMPSNGA